MSKSNKNFTNNSYNTYNTYTRTKKKPHVNKYDGVITKKKYFINSYRTMS